MIQWIACSVFAAGVFVLWVLSCNPKKMKRTVKGKKPGDGKKP
jgi:hypothetical protein